MVSIGLSKNKQHKSNSFFLMPSYLGAIMIDTIMSKMTVVGSQSFTQ